MSLFSELRQPTRWYSQLIVLALALASLTILCGVILAGFVIYRIVSPKDAGGVMDLANFPRRPQEVSFSVPDSGTYAGWFFPGLKSAPTIFLCHGYNANRGELLPLATALQDHQYNVFVFNFGHPTSRARFTLGFRETEELRAAVEAIAARHDVDRGRFGLWGTDMGAYAAASMAEADPRVRALAIESVFDSPPEMARLLVARFGLKPLPFVLTFVERGFVWANYKYRDVQPLSAKVSRLAGVPKLFLLASDEPGLIRATHQLFVQAPEPKEEAMLARGNYAEMLSEERRQYENRIVAFFLLNLPTDPPVQTKATGLRQPN